MSTIAQLILQSMPDIIRQIQQRHEAAHPGAATPTPEEIVAAFDETFASTIAKDQMIRAAITAQS